MKYTIFSLILFLICYLGIHIAKFTLGGNYPVPGWIGICILLIMLNVVFAMFRLMYLVITDKL